MIQEQCKQYKQYFNPWMIKRFPDVHWQLRTHVIQSSMMPSSRESLTPLHLTITSILLAARISHWASRAVVNQLPQLRRELGQLRQRGGQVPQQGRRGGALARRAVGSVRLRQRPHLRRRQRRSRLGLPLPAAAIAHRMLSHRLCVKMCGAACLLWL
jgi:hypothetical protein